MALHLGALVRQLLALDALLLQHLGADTVALRLPLGHRVRHPDEGEIQRQIVVGGRLLEQTLRLLEQTLGQFGP